MFGASFSYTPFSLRLEVGSELNDAISMAESITAVIGIADVEDDFESFRESISGSMRGAATILETARMEEAVCIHGELIANIPDVISMVEVIRNFSYIEVESYNNEYMFEKVHGKLAVGSVIYNSIIFAEQITLTADMGIELYLFDRMDEFLNALASVIATSQEVIDVGITIPPGGVLEIDSESFTVTLNGANILHLYADRWPVIDASVYDITVSAGGGVVTSHLIYSERWL